MHSASPTTFYEGPVTRTVEDCALAMTAMQGFDARDPVALSDTVDFAAALTRGIQGTRIGFTADYGIFPVETAVAQTVSHAVAAFESLGATVDAVDLNIPYAQAELSTMWCRLTAIGVYESMRRLARDGIDLRTACPDELPPSMMYWVDRVPRLTIDDLLRDQTVRTTVLDRFNAVFDEFDFIVAPTVTRLPVLKADNGDTLGPSMINGESIDPS